MTTCLCECRETHDRGEAAACLDGSCELCGDEAGNHRWGFPADDGE